MGPAKPAPSRIFIFCKILRKKNFSANTTLSLKPATFHLGTIWIPEWKELSGKQYRNGTSVPKPR
jgi:hypothetical protein